MKIIGFAQLRNELSKGNLHNWFRSMEVCDYIYIYDQGSDDGSQEVYRSRENIYVIQSDTNRFQEEISCKRQLLHKLLEDHPDVDWIFWMDGDTILDGRIDRTTLENVFIEAEDMGSDAIKMRHFNLWRSDNWTRTDNQYHDLYQYGVTAFWKNNGKLEFPSSTGLHLNQFPNGISHAVMCPFFLIHRGFSSDNQIIERYNLYKSRGQSGHSLERLLDEDTLDGYEINYNCIPKWFNFNFTGSPKAKRLIREIYEEKYRNCKPNI